jgi:SAM-dependent methyltransferase
MIKTVKFMDQELPFWVADGFHSQYIIPFASKICQGVGLDVGCGKEAWKFPGAIAVDPAMNRYSAEVLPLNPFNDGWDYIFSSHCLEHIESWEEVLKYWTQNIRPGGVLFLYLPHPDCLYWRPELMPTKRHLHSFSPEQMKKKFEELGYKNIFCSERDLSWSFAVCGERI